MREGPLTLLISRPADLAILAVTATGMVDVPIDAGEGARWRAGPGARIRLTFPPQAIAEALLANPAATVDARLSGVSALDFAIDADREFDLTAEGILGAVREAGRLLPAAAVGAEGSVVELPWGLLGTPIGAWTDEPVTSDHPAGPLASPDGVIGLWQATLRAEHGLAFRALLPLADPMPGPTALSGDARRAIVDAGQAVALPQDLTLSALGGSAAFRLAGRDITWSHDIALGRDARVRVVREGMLYPFGHRAVLVEAAERQMTDLGDGAVAGVQRTVMRILVAQRTRRTARPDFPFDAVEVLVDAIDFAAHGGPADPPVNHPAPGTVGPLQQQLADANAAIAPFAEVVWAWLEAIPRPPTFEWLAFEWGSGTAAEYVELGRQIDELQIQIDDDLSTNEERAEARRAMAPLVQRQRVLNPLVRAEIAALPHTRDGLIAGLAERGNPDAAQYVVLSQQIAGLTRAIADAQAHVQQDAEVAFVPYDAAGRAIAVPVRCHGALADVDVSMPLLFVHDFTWRVDVQGVDFASLIAPSTIAGLRTAWQPHATVPVPGVAVDLVRSAPAQPGDVHEVHALQLTSAGYDGEVGAYVPRLEQADVRVRGWPLLLPGEDARVTVAYPATPAPGDVALDIVTPAAIDFTGRADRSGGLAVPKVAVDGISRALGPVPKGALPGAGAEALRRIYADTTVLGFSLADLLGAPDVAVARMATADAGVFPQPPALIAVQGTDGSAGVRFEWLGVPLRGSGIFRVPATDDPDAEPSTLDIVATLAPDHSETRCTLTRVGLVLPPVAPVVQLDFASLTCRTTPGKAPAVDIGDLKVAFLGPLKLLNGLQERLQDAIQGTGVTLERTSDGIRAGYAVSIPDVAAGAFQLQNVAASVSVDVPFTGRRVAVRLAFASPDNPFRVAVLAFGGGGYAVVEIEGDAVSRVDVSLDFGASLAVDFRVASADVHLIGGLSIRGDGHGVQLVAFLRMGGSIQLLGVVSISVELKLLLTYDDADGANRLVGRARLVVEVDLLFFSKSLELDTGEWVLAGGSGPSGAGRARSLHAAARDTGAARVAALDAGADPDDPGRQRWIDYQMAFAEDALA